MGGLLNFPFTAEIWGTAAEWANAILTGGAFTIAALVYWRDSNLSKRVQAKLVRPRFIQQGPDGGSRVLVENYSDSSIFEVRVLVTRSSFEDAVFFRPTAWKQIKFDIRTRGAFEEIVEKQMARWRAIERNTGYKQVDRVEAKQHCEFDIPYPFMQKVSVTFTDVNGQVWHYPGVNQDDAELTEGAAPLNFPYKRHYKPPFHLAVLQWRPIRDLNQYRERNRARAVVRAAEVQALDEEVREILESERKHLVNEPEPESETD